MNAPVLAEGETLIDSFSGDKPTYIKEHVLIAAIGSVAAVAVLMAMGEAHAWTGVVGAVAAVAVRGFYVASEQLHMTWHLTDRRLISPTGVSFARREIETVRTIFSAAQVVTKDGHKHLIKYQADAKATAQKILSM